MKRFLCLLLSLTMLFALASCGGEKPSSEPRQDEIIIETEPENLESENGETVQDELPAISPDSEKPAEETKKEDEKPAATQKPAEPQKPAATQKPAEPQKPAATQKPVEPQKPAEPTTPPASNPPAAEAPSTGGTVGDTLAAVWRSNSSKSAEEIANAVISHSSIGFAGGVVPVEEGLLTGFDNTEIKGFSSGYMLAPMIGTIPFVGYVFELADGTNADAFASLLKRNANPRWNICTEAEQTIVEKSGNKVFFLMCPKSFE